MLDCIHNPPHTPCNCPQSPWQDCKNLTKDTPSMNAVLTQLQLFSSTLGPPQSHGHPLHHTFVLSPHAIAALSYGWSLLSMGLGPYSGPLSYVDALLTHSSSDNRHQDAPTHGSPLNSAQTDSSYQTVTFHGHYFYLSLGSSVPAVPPWNSLLTCFGPWTHEDEDWWIQGEKINHSVY